MYPGVGQWGREFLAGFQAPSVGMCHHPHAQPLTGRREERYNLL